MDVTPKTYGWMTQQLLNFSNDSSKKNEDTNRVIVVLEGGYNLNSISNSALACLLSLTRTKTYEDITTEVPTKEGLAAIAATIAAHRDTTAAWATKSLYGGSEQKHSSAVNR